MDAVKKFEEPKTAADFGGLKEITHTDEKGKTVKYLLLRSGRIAKVKEGKGSDVEKASIEADGDQSKYMSSMIASCTEIDGKGITMFDLSELSMKDYMQIQVAFSELNF